MSKFSSQSATKFLNLTEVSQFDSIKTESSEEPVFLIKHSTSCGISHAALDQVEQFISANPDVKFYYLDLLAYRPVSNAAADAFGVPHQSPQVIVVKGGETVKHTSHYAIDVDWLSKALES